MVQCLLDDRDMPSVCVCALVALYPSIFVYAILIIAYLCNNFDQTDDGIVVSMKPLLTQTLFCKTCH